jgi:hypothetical protein
MTADTWVAIAAILTLAATVVGAGIVIWGKLAVVQTGMAALQKTLDQLMATGLPFCGSHAAMLTDHSRRLDRHEERIVHLERKEE